MGHLIVVDCKSFEKEWKCLCFSTFGGLKISTFGNRDHFYESLFYSIGYSCT